MISENFKMALSSIRNARFRSLLTMLGIVIGVLSVITAASIGEGIKRQISGQTRSIGSDLITIRPGNLVKRDSNNRITGVNLLSFLSASSISEKDLETVNSNPQIQSVVPFSIINGTPSIGNKKMDQGFVMATSDKMTEVVSKKVEFGNFFDEDIKDRKVAVIGFGVAEKLFEESVPIGKTMQIRGQDFVVTGVYERFPTNPMNPEIDLNNGVYIPFEAGKLIAGTELDIYEIVARPKDKSSNGVDKAIKSINDDLRATHAGENDFTVLRQEELVMVADNLLKLVTNSVSLMAAITLIVGGVGIMNVMLVSVTERTREIGIRKAVGASNRQIRSQFLIEAIVISVWGALIGTIGAGIVNLLLRIFTNLQPVITWQVVALSTLISVGVGIIFGLIPAYKASRKDPIESLRSY